MHRNTSTFGCRGPPPASPRQSPSPPPPPPPRPVLPAHDRSHPPPRPYPCVLSPPPASVPDAVSPDCALARVSRPSPSLPHPCLSHCWRPCPSRVPACAPCRAPCPFLRCPRPWLFRAQPRAPCPCPCPRLSLLPALPRCCWHWRPARAPAPSCPPPVRPGPSPVSVPWRCCPRP